MASTGSSRSCCGGNEATRGFDGKGQLQGSSASLRAITRVNIERAPKTLASGGPAIISRSYAPKEGERKAELHRRRYNGSIVFIQGGRGWVHLAEGGEPVLDVVGGELGGGRGSGGGGGGSRCARWGGGGGGGGGVRAAGSSWPGRSQYCWRVGPAVTRWLRIDRSCLPRLSVRADSPCFWPAVQTSRTGRG